MEYQAKLFLVWYHSPGPLTRADCECGRRHGSDPAGTEVRRSNSLEQEGWPKAGVVVKSKWLFSIPKIEWGGELFDPSTTPALRATPPVPGGE